MPCIVTSQETENALRELLRANGYTLSAVRSNGETGPDIIASRGAERIHVEVIGFKSSPPARAKDFFESFFRAVSRIKDGAEKCVIAVPSRFREGLPARAGQYGEAWTRIGNAFPELEIWLIDIHENSRTATRWNDWLCKS